MKRILLIWTLLIVCFSFAFGQAPTDSIRMEKIFGGYQFYQGNNRLKMSQLVRIMQPNEQAYKEIKAAQSTNTIASVIGGIGGFMVGWTLGTVAGGGEPIWAMAGVGAGLIAVAIPISHKFNKQAKTAVNTFNGGLKTSSLLNKTELEFACTENGIGLVLKF